VEAVEVARWSDGALGGSLIPRESKELQTRLPVRSVTPSPCLIAGSGLFLWLLLATLEEMVIKRKIDRIGNA
jgi:hypothetical protein